MTVLNLCLFTVCVRAAGSIVNKAFHQVLFDTCADIWSHCWPQDSTKKRKKEALKSSQSDGKRHKTTRRDQDEVGGSSLGWIDTVVLEFIRPLSGKFCVFVSQKKYTISGTISKHYSYFSYLQSNNLFSKHFRPFLRLGQCS